MSASESNSALSVIILAAGAGTRMKSSLPKPLHPVGGRPMLAQVLSVARELEPRDITIVGSPELRRLVETETWANGALLAIQDPPHGTGDAVRVALAAGASGATVLVLYADHPLVTREVLDQLVGAFDPKVHRLSVMTCQVDDAAGYGRIVRDTSGRIQEIVEKDIDDLSLRSGPTEINSGFMVLDRAWTEESIPLLPPHRNKHGDIEYFLTDLVSAASNQDRESVTSVTGSDDVLVGINTRTELVFADSLLVERKRRQLVNQGVTLLSPESNRIDLDVEVGEDTTIGPGCVLEAGTRIGAGCRIGPNAIIRDSVIGTGVRIESSTVEHSSIDADSDVGPYSHIRGGTRIGRQVHIGNFAELKNATVGDSVRIGHFSYIGDARLGADVNIGAGTVTCNFDGVDKHQTEIGAGAFIGSDTMLVAPVTIGPGARTGAGAVVNKDVAAGATVVGMPARQIRRVPAESPNSHREGADG